MRDNGICKLWLIAYYGFKKTRVSIARNAMVDLKGTPLRNRFN